MNKLIICNTNYQIIMALHMKSTVFKNVNVDICVTDHIPNASLRAEGIIKTKLFRNVLSITSLPIVKRNGIFYKIVDSIYYGLGFSHLHKQLGDYEEIVLYNYDISLYEIINALERKKNDFIISKYDEGLFSYNTEFYITGLRFNIIEFLRTSRNKRNISSMFKYFYCIYPQLKTIHTEWTSIELPGWMAEIDKLKKYLIDVYGNIDCDIRQKYIYFASASDIDNCSYGEVDFLKKVIDKVGSDNLIVKRHPRDTRDIYNQLGVDVFNKNDIPWEIYQILLPQEDKVLVTVTSGAFISVSAMLESNCKGVFLYPEINTFNDEYKNYVHRIDETIRNLHKLSRCSNIIVGNLDILDKKGC